MAGLLKKHRIVFLGAGNMAEAIVRGLLRGKAVAPAQVTVTDVRPERLAHFRKRYRVRAEADNHAAVAKASVVVLAVKPQDLRELLRGLRGAVPGGAVVLSIAAGVRTAGIEKLLGRGARVVRAMPNTPALVGAGIAGICKGKKATERDMQVAEAILGTAGLTVRVKESDMDAVTALSGSGPAYVFFIVEAMLEAARHLRVKPETAKTLIHRTIDGAVKLLVETGEEAETLRARVTSKGGTTAAAIEQLAAGGVSDAVVKAIKAAHRRSRELSRN